MNALFVWRCFFFLCVYYFADTLTLYLLLKTLMDYGTIKNFYDLDECFMVRLDDYWYFAAIGVEGQFITIISIS